tara:strand:- start:216 stop:320 length:105 start_codon:yes stop_codon:yes gene_type:complete
MMDYSDIFLKNILEDTKSIAIVGASSKPIEIVIR